MIRKIILLVLVVGSLHATTGTAQVTNHRVPGALEPTHLIGCVAVPEVEPHHTAADIAYGARACAEESNFAGSAELILMASAFAFYDTRRVTDPTSHQALNALFAESIGSLPEPLPASVFTEIESLDGSRSRKEEICRTLTAANPPSYVPAYMIAHGMEAVRGGARHYKEPPGFVAQQSWREALAFVGCG